MLRCASGGRLLTTKGSTGAPVNFGMFATATSEESLTSIMWYSQHAEWTKDGLEEYKGGWDNAGAWPFKQGFAGYGCDQGIVWTFYYGNGLAIGNATFAGRSHLAAAARVIHKFHLVPHIIDRCRYNYQRENDGKTRRTCGESFNCSQVALVHKQHKHTATFDGMPRLGVCGCKGLDGSCGAYCHCTAENWHELKWP